MTGGFSINTYMKHPISVAELLQERIDWQRGRVQAGDTSRQVAVTGLVRLGCPCTSDESRGKRHA